MQVERDLRELGLDMNDIKNRDVPESIFLLSTGYRVIRRFFAESGYRVPSSGLSI